MDKGENLSDAQYPMAPNQAFVVHATKGKEHTGRTNISTTFWVGKEYRLQDIIIAISKTIDETAALNLMVIRDNNGNYRQNILNTKDREVEVFDYINLSYPDAIEAVRIKASELSWKDFQPEGAEAVRSFVIVAQQGILVGIVINHIFADMISRKPLKKQFFHHLHGKADGVGRGLAPAPQYTDFIMRRAEWDRVWKTLPQAGRWHDLLQHIEESADNGRQYLDGNYAGGLPIRVDRGDACALGNIALQERVPSFIVILSIFAISAYVLNSCSNMSVAVVRDERPNVGYHKVVGNFAAITPFFVTLDCDLTFQEVVRRVKVEWAKIEGVKWTPSELTWSFLRRPGYRFILDFISIEEQKSLGGAGENFNVDIPPLTALTAGAGEEAKKAMGWDSLFFMKEGPGNMFFWSWAGAASGYSGSSILQMFHRASPLLLQNPEEKIGKALSEVLS